MPRGLQPARSVTGRDRVRIGAPGAGGEAASGQEGGGVALATVGLGVAFVPRAARVAGNPAGLAHKNLRVRVIAGRGSTAITWDAAAALLAGLPALNAHGATTADLADRGRVGAVAQGSKGVHIRPRAAGLAEVAAAAAPRRADPIVAGRDVAGLAVGHAAVEEATPACRARASVAARLSRTAARRANRDCSPGGAAQARGTSLSGRAAALADTTTLGAASDARISFAPAGIDHAAPAGPRARAGRIGRTAGLPRAATLDADERVRVAVEGRIRANAVGAAGEAREPAGRTGVARASRDVSVVRSRAVGLGASTACAGRPAVAASSRSRCSSRAVSAGAAPAISASRGRVAVIAGAASAARESAGRQSDDPHDLAHKKTIAHVPPPQSPQSPDPQSSEGRGGSPAC
jgi:hypothetical protein